MAYENPFQNNSPIMSGLLRALQAKSMIENLKNDALDREYRQQELGFRREQQAAINRRANERLQFEQGKESARRGTEVIKQIADEGKLGSDAIRDVGDFWFSKNKGGFVPSHSGEKTGFKRQSQEQIDQREIDTSVRKVGAEERARRDARPKIALPPEMVAKFGVSEVPSDTIGSYVQLYNAGKPDYYFGTQTDANGNTTIVAVDKKTLKPSSIPAGKIGKPSSTTATNDKGLALKAETERKRVQGLIDKAKAFDANSDPDDEGKAKMSRQLWDNARRESDRAVQMYPDHLKGGAGAGGYAFIDRANPSGGAKAQPQSGQVQSAKPARNFINKAQYQELVTKYGKKAADDTLKAQGIKVQ